MSSTTADALGLSRAILVNGNSKKHSKITNLCHYDVSLDTLVKKLAEIEDMAQLYRGLIKHARRFLIGLYDLARIHRDFGDAFANIGAREPQRTASLAFTQFGDAHRQLHQHAMTLLGAVAPV